jgi:hypothetical protein
MVDVEGVEVVVACDPVEEFVGLDAVVVGRGFPVLGGQCITKMSTAWAFFFDFS